MIRVPIAAAPPLPLPQMTLRSRREPSTRDFVNAQQYEHWQTDGRYGIQNRPDLNKQAPFYDMAPLSSRTDDRNYLQNQPFVAGGAPLGDNPYFQKYDVTNDPRNVARELRGAVFEIPSDRGLKESQRMLERQFTAQYVPADRTREDTETRLDARAQLMPSMDDYRKLYPKVINTGQVCQTGSVPKSSETTFRTDELPARGCDLKVHGNGAAASYYT